MDLTGLDPLQIVTLVVVLVVVWVVLRFVLKVATRILASGCAVIVLIAIALFLINSIN